MHLNTFQIIAFTLFFSCSRARNSRSLEQIPNVITNRSVEDQVQVTKRDESKYVFMHFIVGNAYPYTIANWIDDIQQIHARGVDAIALNFGKDDWELTQVANAYTAVESSGTDLKMFISPDFTSLDCSVSDKIASVVNKYRDHPNQFKVDGRPMISSYEGGCMGNAGWANLKSQTNGYLMPFISGLESSFSQWPSLDSWLCWGCCWSNHVKTTADDKYYINLLGQRYATTVSGWMFTHFDYKNWYQSSGDWLINTRWEELISMRDSLTFVEMVTWNDFGESDYFGSITPIGNEPWAEEFPHFAWFEMSQYYITAFKTGRYPAISKDVIYFWARPHPANATASSDPLPRPTGYEFAKDYMWAVVFATSNATVVLQCGSASSTSSVKSGVNKLKVSLAGAGGMSVKMVRNGQTIISETAENYTYNLHPTLYNFNAWVGSATASIANTNTYTSTSSSTSSLSTETSSASTAKRASTLVPPTSSSSSLSTKSSSASTSKITTLGTSTSVPPPTFSSSSPSTKTSSALTSKITTSSIPQTSSSQCNTSPHTSKSSEYSSSSSPSIKSSSAPTGNTTILKTSTSIPPTTSSQCSHTLTSSKCSSSSSLSTKASSAPNCNTTPSRTSTSISLTSSPHSSCNSSTHTSKSSEFSSRSSPSTKSSSVPTGNTPTLRTSTSIPPTSSHQHTTSTLTSTSSESYSSSSLSTKTSSTPAVEITTLVTITSTWIFPSSSLPQDTPLPTSQNSDAIDKCTKLNILWSSTACIVTVLLANFT